MERVSSYDVHSYLQKPQQYRESSEGHQEGLSILKRVDTREYVIRMLKNPTVRNKERLQNELGTHLEALQKIEQEYIDSSEGQAYINKYRLALGAEIYQMCQVVRQAGHLERFKTSDVPITSSEIYKVVYSGQPFNVSWVTYDRKRPRDRENIVTVQNAHVKANRPNAGYQRRVNQKSNKTITIHFVNDIGDPQIRALHVDLIVMFNGRYRT